MYYGLVFFPKVEIERINKIRRKYDPTFDMVDPHLPILYPVPSSLGKKKIIKHIRDVLTKWQPFTIQFGGLKKSQDHWLLLTLKDGNYEIKKLSADLYSGFLSEYRREDIEFIPHIGLGLFAKNYSQYDPKNPQELVFDENTYRQALSEAESMDFDFQCTVDMLELVELNEDFTSLKSIKIFPIE